MAQAIEIGPIVFCDYADQDIHTHRLSNSGDPWFCFYCGATDHKAV